MDTSRSNQSQSSGVASAPARTLRVAVKEDNHEQVLLGDGRKLFANHFFVKADVSFHSGYYPSIFDQAQPSKDTRHMMEHHEHAEGAANEHDALHLRERREHRQARAGVPCRSACDPRRSDEPSMRERGSHAVVFETAAGIESLVLKKQPARLQPRLLSGEAAAMGASRPLS